MWSFVCSKFGISLISGFVLTALVGFTLLYIRTIKTENDEAMKRINSLQSQLMDSYKAIEGCKETISNKDNEIDAHKNQVLAGNVAIKNYKESLDKAKAILDKAQCVPADEKTGVLDAKSNDEIVDALNCLSSDTSASCIRLPRKAGN